jgi:ABC-type proline/glycine betaine transport system permease subunit
MAIDVGVYTLARLLLAAVLTALIFFLAQLFAIVVALPLGIWVFAPLRRRATASIAEFDERRRTDRDQLRARLRGDESAAE